MKLHNTFNKIN